MRADHLFILAGTLAFIGNFKKDGGFPDNGGGTIAATMVLAFLAAITRDSPIAGPFKAFAALALLASIMYYVPVLTNTKKRNS